MMEREKIEFNVKKGQSLRIPNKEKYPNGLDIIVVMNKDDPPLSFTMDFEWIRCHGTFSIGPKETNEYIIRVKNCKFDNLVGPNDGTILEIDQDSKQFIEDTSRTLIQGFNEIKII